MCGDRFVVDPSQPGDRIKTDRRDAINLAKLHRTGELTSVWVRDEAYETIRDLVRARQAGCAPCDKPACNCPGSCSPRPSLSSPVVDVAALELADQPEFDQAIIISCWRSVMARHGGTADFLHGSVASSCYDRIVRPSQSVIVRGKLRNG
jgi:hypothetical protein